MKHVSVSATMGDYCHECGGRCIDAPSVDALAFAINLQRNWDEIGKDGVVKAAMLWTKRDTAHIMIDDKLMTKQKGKRS